MRSIVFLILLSVAACSIAGDTWSAVLETGDDDFLYGLRDAVVLSNGTTVISIAGPFEDPYLVCLDRAGKVLWYRHVLENGGTSRAFESDGNLIAIEDGFAACFHSEPRATGIDTDIAVIRMDSSGEVIWTYIFGESDDGVWMSTDIIPCSDGGVFVTGCPGMQIPEGFAFKLSSHGLLEWTTFSQGLECFAISAVETENGDFLVLVIDEYSNRTVVQRVTSSGMVSPPLTVAETTIRFEGSIEYINESLWIVSPISGHGVRAFRLDDDFNTVETVEMQLPPEYEVSSASMLEDGIVVSGKTDDGNALLSTYAFDGTLIWEREYDTGGNGVLYGTTVVDDGILTFGNTRTFPRDEHAFWVLKTDRDGFVEGALVRADGTLMIEPEAETIDLISLGWLAAITVLDSEEDALETSSLITGRTGLQTGYLWIPDWQSLSGADGWLVYAEPYGNNDVSLETGFALLLELYPDTYFIWVSQSMERTVMSVEEFLIQYLFTY